jgi:hypothetical protein
MRCMGDRPSSPVKHRFYLESNYMRTMPSLALRPSQQCWWPDGQLPATAIKGRADAVIRQETQFGCCLHTETTVYIRAANNIEAASTPSLR